MFDSKEMFGLGLAFMNAGEANFREDVIKDRSEYQNAAGVVNIAFACELFLKCLLNMAGTEVRGHEIEDLWQEYKKLCGDEADLSPLIGYRLSYTVKEEQSSYNKAFVECNDNDNRGELTMFVEMFLNILTESMRNLVLSLEKRKTAWDKYIESIDDLPFGKDKYYPGVYRTLILYKLFAPFEADIDDIMKGAKISRPTLKKILDSLEKEDLIEVGSSGKKHTYSIRLEKLDGLIQ